ncbi:type I DNA topoisomerase [Patescibacteria group bacterium]|nr:type I DNA topoisomerase [Patescibacteria group bacterium]MBU0964445.1 type I DNA topoisomerase [Patescibacteria group bacterium]
MAKNLIIVESPTKARTVSKYLSSLPFDVKASVGHIRDLPKSNKKAIDIKAGFVPHYEISKGKEKIVQELKKLATKADQIYLATDPDREGEAIAWHIAEILKNGDNPKQYDIKRVVFHEITKSAIEEAIKNPRLIDQSLRKAQEARRVLDRLVGYDLSGLIWKKVRYGLSAGRVQSPALRILVEREREIKAFKPVTYWSITADLKTKAGDKIKFTCHKEPKDKKTVEGILQAGKKEPWQVAEVKESKMTRVPRAPFTTSTLQQTASSRLGYAPSRTMRTAQRLYEAGHITYMRTDSVNISKEIIPQIASVINKEYGQEHLQLKNYKTTSKNAQEAHEAIRPTKLYKQIAGHNDEQKRLYTLIRQRTLASQMADAQLKKTKIIATINKQKIPDFSVNGSRITYPGWLLADPAARNKEVDLPKVAAKDPLTLIDINSEEKQTQPLPRYSEAGLVKELEKRGIGRPSTYAAIIKTIVDRGYVERENRSLHPTDTGEVVSEFLENNFAKYISDSFTAELEDELDEIANGKREYLKTLKDFYGPFSKDVKDKENIKKITTLGEADKNIKCPKCGLKMVIKLGRSGKFLSCAKFPDCVGARTIEGIELEGPKETGEKCPDCKDGKLVEREGRFGKFISCSNYPKCKHIKNSENNQNSTGIKCTECKKGELVERRGRFGLFYSCSEYPKCKYAIKAKPTGKNCDYVRESGTCGALMMEGTKTIPERCSDKTCPNHNPHKLK